MKKKITPPLYAFFSLATLLAYLFIVQPDVNKPVTVVVPPLLALLFMYFFMVTILSMFKINPLITKLTALLISTTMSLLLAFSAVGGLKAGDLLLFTALILLTVFYAQRSWKK